MPSCLQKKRNNIRELIPTLWNLSVKVCKMKRRWKFPWQTSQAVFTCCSDTQPSPGWSRAAPLLLADVPRLRTRKNTADTKQILALPSRGLCGRTCCFCQAWVCVWERKREIWCPEIKRKKKYIVRGATNTLNQLGVLQGDISFTHLLLKGPLSYMWLYYLYKRINDCSIHIYNDIYCINH